MLDIVVITLLSLKEFKILHALQPTSTCRAYCPLILQDMRMRMPQKINYILSTINHQKKRWNEMPHNRLKQHHWSNISPKEPQIGAETERPLSPCTLIIFFKISQGGLSHYSQLQKIWSKNACILSWAYGTFWTRWVSTTNRFQLPTNLEHELPLRI